MPVPNIVSFGTITIDKHSGPAGTLVTVSNTGTGFFGAMEVTVGGESATDETVIDHQHMTFKTGGSATGDVVITNPDGETVTLAGEWISVLSGRSSLYIGIAIC